MSRTPLLTATGLVAAAIAFAGCDRNAEAPVADPPAPQADAPAEPHTFDASINVGDFAQRVKTLASDEFGGRAPGSPGGDRTVEYLNQQFQQMGLEPGNGDSYFQTVQMTQTTADPSTVLTLTVDGQPRTLAFGEDMVINTRTGQEHVQIDDSQLVFVGYGANAPEKDWNDYAGVDVEGKTVVMFVNDPGFHAQDPELFEGKRMTYYGRWTYKYEEAARQGAAAAIIIHDTPGASYDWSVVENSWSGAQFDLPAKDDPAPRLPAQGWITGDAARALFADLGYELDELYQKANQRDFEAFELDASLSLDLNSTIEHKTSRNVIAKLPGVTRPDEAIVYMAHWDHLGTHAGGGHGDGEGADAGGDTIYNGAIDNATGVAGILGIAEKFAAQTPPPDRSLLFLAVTLEESGLLGSKYYVAHPTVPLEDTVAVVNLDALPVIGKTRDMTVVGFGSSQLEDVLKQVADQQGRVLHAEATPESGFYFRSDHFNFAKAGVPALYARSGSNLVDGGTEGGLAALADYRDNRYHQPADEFSPDWDMQGVIQDLQALYGVGNVLAYNEQWPNWYEGNAFRAAHDKLVEARKQ